METTVLILLWDDEVIDDNELILLLSDSYEEPLHQKYNRFQVDNFLSKEFRKFFCFEKEHIHKLATLLHLQVQYCSATRLRWDAIEGLCLLLRHLCYPNRLVDIVPSFRRSVSECSIIVNYMLTEILSTNMHRLHTVQQPWVDFQRFTEAVTRKGLPLTNVWAFINGTLVPTCRPIYDQEAVFSGHKRCHGVKCQHLTCPNGIVLHAYGPFHGRRHDMYMYMQSLLENQIANLQLNGHQLAIYGDAVYNLKPYFYMPSCGANLSPDELMFNRRMSHV